jgi:hypothetical protein
MKISRETAKQIIFDTLKVNNGQIFGVQFFKKDGSLRDMVARLGVTKHLKGGVKNYNPEDFNLITAFDMQKKEYRSISINTLTQLKVDGQIFDVE